MDDDDDAIVVKALVSAVEKLRLGLDTTIAEDFLSSSLYFQPV